MLLYTLLLTDIGSLYNAFVGDYTNFVIARVITGVGIGADLALVNAYINEMAPGIALAVDHAGIPVPQTGSHKGPHPAHPCTQTPSGGWCAPDCVLPPLRMVMSFAIYLRTSALFAYTGMSIP